jgi:hypothetical protein
MTVRLGGGPSWAAFSRSPYLGLAIAKHVPEREVLSYFRKYFLWFWINTLTTVSLYGAFNQMVRKLGALIDQSYKQKILVQKAQLKQLQAQINPHFLYNSYFILHRMVTEEDTENAARFSRQLGMYLRYITRDAEEEVPLSSEIEEAAFIDGAGHWTALWRIYVPLSLPALATLVLFCSVNHWNSWFDGIILMNRMEHYPLQSYLQTVIVQQGMRRITIQDMQEMAGVSDRTNKAAQIFIGALPILLLYPFLQRYFMSGIVMGSVKG